MCECDSPGMKNREPASASRGTISRMFLQTTDNFTTDKVN